MTTKGRITTDQIKSLPYPTEWVEANSENVKVKFQDLLTSIQ